MEGDLTARLRENLNQVTDSELSRHLTEAAKELEPYQGGDNILTDDQAPVEVLGMRAIDGLIQKELEYYQEKYRTEGISGILQSF